MVSTSSNTKSPNKQTPDAITAEEISGYAPVGHQSLDTDTNAHKRSNAFTEMMSQSKKPKTPNKPTTCSPDTLGQVKKGVKIMRNLHRRDELKTYLEDLETNPTENVVEYDDDFVVINDKYPKASIHLLLIPRKSAYYDQHPLELLSTNPEFLAKVRESVARVKILAASELRRQFGHLSASDAPYQEALEAVMSSSDPPPPPEERAALLPPGRDWESEIVAGVHTHPSMNHLHIHIFSRDMHSSCLKHKKHYLSFNSGFLVKLEEFPLEEGNERFHPGGWPNWDMKCWRCGKNFKNKFAALKEHLEEEFEAWKSE